jgi:hypothetical protein
MSDTEYGEALVERVDEAIALGEAATGAAALLELAAGEDGEAAGEMPPPATLFDAFAYPRNAGARRRLERWFRLVAPPGRPLRVAVEPGDLLVRRALGDGGMGHVALIAAPDREPLDRALAGGWRVEGMRPGAYVRVVEAGPRPCLLRDRFARRLLDARGVLPLDTLVLRPRIGVGAWEAEDAEQAAPAPRLPAGKGMWTGNLAGAGTPAQMAARMRDNGVSWLAVHVLEIGGERRNPRRTLERYFTALRAELTDPALGFWLWGWPPPGRHEVFVPAIVTAASEVGAQGVIIDVEAHWKWRAGNAARERLRREQATALMDRLLPAAHGAGLSVGFTSYGAPWFHRNFPWAQFTRADFSLPQIYDAENTADVATFAPRCDREWRDMGFPAIMPISNAYNKTAAQMRLLLAATPVTDGAISWWWWHAASTARWGVIRDFAVPPRPAPAPALPPAPAPTGEGDDEDVPFPFLEELEAAEGEALEEMGEAAGPVTFPVGRVVPARRFVDLPLTYEEWIDNADRTGLVLQRTRCDTLAHVTAQGRTMPLGDDGTFEYAISHADLITSMSAVPMLWQTGAGGRLQAALDLVIHHPADPTDPDLLPPGRETFPLVVICMGNHGVCSTTSSGAADPPTGALGATGLPLRLFHAATLGAEVPSHHGYSAVTRGRPPGVTTGPASVPYLQEELATHGMVSVSVSTNPANYFDLLLETRADLVLAAVAEMRRLNADRSSRFYRRIDFDRVALVGHSRGGDAVVRAAHKGRSANVRALVQLAPTDITGLLRGRAPAGVVAGRTDAVAAPMRVTAGMEAFQLLIYGSRDGDVSGLQDVRLSEFGEPFRHYDRSSAHRSFLFWHGATHNRFNRFWEDADEEPLLDRASGGLLDRPEQERRTREAVGACLRFVLNREAAEAERLNGRVPTAISPALPVAAMWKFGRALKTIDRFEDVRADRNTLGGRNLPPSGGLVDEIVLANENPPGAGLTAFQFMHVDRVLRGSLPSSAPPGTGALTSGRWRAQIPPAHRDFRPFTLLTLRVTKRYDPSQLASGAPAATLLPRVRVRLLDAAGASADRTAAGRLSTLPSVRQVTVGARTFDLTKFHFETWEVDLGGFAGVNLGRVAAVEVEMAGLGGQPVYVDTVSLVRL